MAIIKFKINQEEHYIEGGGIQNDTTGTTSVIEKIWRGTKVEYDALSSYNNDYYYIITDESGEPLYILNNTEGTNERVKSIWYGTKGEYKALSTRDKDCLYFVETEVIVIKMKADSNGDLKVPVAGYSPSGTQDCLYNWLISVDGGDATQYTGTGSAGAITVATGLTADSEHLIKISPIAEEYQRARAFGFENSGVETLLTEIVSDDSYMGYGVSATDTGSLFKYGQYLGCTSLTTAPDEVLPNTVTTIGTGFRDGQYLGCTSLTTAPDEVLPNSVTSIGDSFRQTQYLGCTSLTTAPDEVLPNSVTTIGSGFRWSQYHQCTSLTTAPAEAMSNYVISIGNGFRWSQYDGCTSLITPSEEILPNSVTSIGNNFRQAQYNTCTSLTTAPDEVLPNSVISIGNQFRQTQYSGCTSLISTPDEVLPSSVTSIGNYFRRQQYYKCTALTTVTGIQATPISVTKGSNFRNTQFTSAGNTTNKMTVTINGTNIETGVTNSLGLANARVQNVQVDSTLIAEYRGSSSWSNITDSKFIAIP